ncbi:hypothetical protein AB6B38_11390 [Glycocaulis abyssi]|uniref:Porin domain-containing protein n=1 Tax=Glycocaulis abyssi TaxID=1433403 RepID=A0ABV9NC95_9PROT
MMTALRAQLRAFTILAAAPVLALAAYCTPAQAQETPFQLDTDFQLSADIVLAPGASSAARSGPYGEIRLDLTAERVLENTNRIGFAGGLVARRDSGRAGLAQSIGNCPPGAADCFDAGGLVPVGAFTGFAAGPGIAGDDPAFAVETAFVYWRGGLAEVRAGYGPGAAALESDPLPGAFWLMRADATRADPAGRNFASVANTMSGHAPKLLVRSVRLAGFRAAASFTPDGDVCGASYCRPSSRPGLIAAASVRDIAELGVSFDHRFAASGVRWTAGMGLSHGRAAGNASAFFDDPWAVSARLIRSQGAWKAGLGALLSNDGVSGARYSAQAASLAYERGDWLFSLEASRARSSLVHAHSDSVLAGASRYFESGFILGVGLAHSRAGEADLSGPERTTQTGGTTRLFLEAGLRF